MIIGLDIGGSKITGIIFKANKALKSLTVVTPKDLAGFKNSLRRLIDFLFAGAKSKGIGAGIPGMVNLSGKVVYAPNLKFLIGLNLTKFLKSLGFKKIAIENDANCFALAEACLGQGRGLKNFVGVTLGTGIGGGLILNGELFGGSHGSAGEIGHMMADNKYIYEFYFQKYRNARDYPRMGLLLGRMAADVINSLDAEAIILGGSVVLAANRFLPGMIREAEKHILNKNIRPDIKISQLKNAGALGAALLVK